MFLCIACTELQVVLLVCNSTYTSVFFFFQLQERHLDQILLNGNNIAVMVPGGKPEES